MEGAPGIHITFLDESPGALERIPSSALAPDDGPYYQVMMNEMSSAAPRAQHALAERSHALGRPAILDDPHNALLDEVMAGGFEWVWMLGVWSAGVLSRDVSRSCGNWREAFLRNLPDLQETDVTGSPLAVRACDLSAELGGEAARARLRDRLATRGLSLILDFVPDRVGLDHPWVTDHPDWLIQGTEDDLSRDPQNRIRLGRVVVARGRVPNYPAFRGSGIQGPRESSLVLQELIGDARYVRDGTDLACRGLYRDLPAWGRHGLRGAC